MTASAFPAIHASKWCHNSHTALTVERKEFPNKSLWVTFSVIYLWFEGKKKVFQPPPTLRLASFPSKSNRKSVTQRVHRVSVASLSPPARRWIINQSKRQWRPEFFNQHIHIHRSERSRRKARTSAAFPPCHRQIQHKGLRAQRRAESSFGNLIWNFIIKTH